MQKVSLVHGSSLIILHTVICFACRFRWRLSQLFYNVFWAMLSCWWRFDFFKYLKRWITSRGCWKKWWDNVHGPFCKLHWNHNPPPPHSTSAPYIPTMWPYYYHDYFDLSSYSATKLSVMGPSWPSWPFGLHENNNTFQESWLWANQQFIKNDQWLPAQNLDIDSKCFSKTKCFTRQCFLFETYKTQETYLFDTSCHFVIYQQFRCYHCSALQNRQPWVKNVTN